MHERLSRVDCRALGFVADSYPRTEEQYKFLKDNLNFEPDIVIVLDCPDETIMKRHKEYKVDPITGRLYSLQEIQDMSHPSVANRLKDMPSESEESMKNR